MRVQFSTDGGVMQIREVPEGADPKTYKYGVLIGPPDLSDLALPTKQIKELNKQLVAAGLGDYSDTRSRRHEMMEIISKVVGRRDKELLRQILYIYQSSYFED